MTIRGQLRRICDQSSAADFRVVHQEALEATHSLDDALADRFGSRSKQGASYLAGPGGAPSKLSDAVDWLRRGLSELEITEVAVRNAEYLEHVRDGRKLLYDSLGDPDTTPLRDPIRRTLGAVDTFLEEVERWSNESERPILEPPARQMVTPEEMRRQMKESRDVPSRDNQEAETQHGREKEHARSLNSSSIRLSKLLGKLYRQENQRESSFARDVERWAALLARDAGGLTADQIGLLDQVHRGEMSFADLRDDRQTHDALISCLGKAREQLCEELAERLGKAYHEPTLWEFVVQELTEEFRIKFDDVDERLGDYCERVNSGTLDSSDDFSVEIARLDAEGFSDELLSAIWEKYAVEADQMGLPKPDDEDKESIALDAEELRILQVLRDKTPQLLTTYELETNTRVTRKTIGPRLNRLIELRLAHRPKGVRGGATITNRGKALLADTGA